MAGLPYTSTTCFEADDEAARLLLNGASWKEAHLFWTCQTRQILSPLSFGERITPVVQKCRHQPPSYQRTISSIASKKDDIKRLKTDLEDLIDCIDAHEEKQSFPAACSSGSDSTVDSQLSPTHSLPGQSSHLTSASLVPVSIPTHTLVPEMCDSGQHDSHIHSPDSEAPSTKREKRSSWSPKTSQSQCEKCGMTFSRTFNYTTHMATHDPDRPRPFLCLNKGCGKNFFRKPELHRHASSVHNIKRHKCGACKKSFPRKDCLARHQRDACPGVPGQRRKRNTASSKDPVVYKQAVQQ